MNIPSYRSLAMAALTLAPLGAHAITDWTQSTDPLVVRALPSNSQVQVQNPPAFSWARYTAMTPAPASYTVQVYSGTTLVQTYTTTRSWYLPSRAFAPGNYTWQVAPTGTTLWSAPHPFIIDANVSKVFEIPENTVLRAAITARSAPRGLPSTLTPYASWSAAMKADRGQWLTWLTNEATKQITNLPTISDTAWTLVTGSTLTAANVAQNSAIRSVINQGGRQLEVATLAYKLTGNTTFRDEALRRGNELAALDPNGPTSYVNQDQGDRVIALSLLKAIDQLGAEVPPVQRQAWLDMVTVRTRPIYNDLSGSDGRLDQYPFDSHGGTNLGFLAIISALGLADIPEATTWFDFAFRSYISQFSVWSGPDGGYANGTAYGQYTVDHILQVWPPLLQATGINIFNKPWATGFLNFFMHFVPPGSKAHLFGDENEIAPDPRLLKAYASRFNTPTAAWYARSLVGNEDPLTLLQAPYPLPVASVLTTAVPPNAALYSSIGWTAMHSNLASLTRTSVYFKSSQYGSFNHSHGDQNTFVLEKGGVPLLVSTGWYDWYGSPLWTSWYRQTKAANGITFDGGVGQGVDGYREMLQRNGKINYFSTSSLLDFVEGDATLAYAGLLTSSIRKLWYMRNQDAVVIYDKDVSPTARVFEWNFHARAPISQDTAGNISTTSGGYSVCVVPVSTGSTYQKRVGPTPKPGMVEDHAVFVKNAAATSAEFIVVLDVGCRHPAISLTATSSGRTLTVGAQSVTLPK